MRRATTSGALAALVLCAACTRERGADAARVETPGPAAPATAHVAPPAHPAPSGPAAARTFAEFRPSHDGFAFRNDFAGSPLPVSLGSAEKKLGLPSRFGLCGGMSSAAADYFVAQHPIPTDTAPPEHGTPLYSYLYSRQSASFGAMGAMALRFIEWMQLPEDGDDGTRARTAREVPAIEAALARGEPVILGLVLVSTKETCEPWQNHQVLAYAAKRDGATLDVSIYDPNFPKRDDAVIRIAQQDGGPVCARIVTGRKPTPVRGLFKMPYAPATPSNSLPPP
jgi:hypothetical protein